MLTKQCNIFGGEDYIESLVDTSKFSQRAQEHIRLLRSVVLETPIIDRLGGLSPEEQKYIQHLREKVALMLVLSV